MSRGGSEPETAVQRYNRLKCEASELWEEVNGMKNEAAAGSDKKKSSAAAGDLNSVGAKFVLCGHSFSDLERFFHVGHPTLGFQLADKVSSLQDELGNMRLEETLGAALVKNLEDPHGSANARLLTHLDQVRLGIMSSAT